MIRLLTIADIVSISNAIFGFLAVLLFLSNELRVSFSLIFLALLADGLDGILARKTGKGKMGEYLEAMADMVSLAIAPLFFVAVTYSEVTFWSIDYILMIIIFLFFIICSLVRLGSFHILKHERYFYGLPASVSTIFILIFSFLHIPFYYILGIIVLLSLGMISPLRFPKPGLRVNAVASVLIIMTLLLGNTFENIAPILLLFAVAVYVLLGPIYLRKTMS
jgi:CDP-diacylglycerol--serine O-phosphatidyltransferase